MLEHLIGDDEIELLVEPALADVERRVIDRRVGPELEPALLFRAGRNL
ncbi:hypothetical protein [Methylobacterium sp. GC_Met_1]|nr:hypothetical protein [Methylobacterium sp. GC_Met_1]